MKNTTARMILENAWFCGHPNVRPPQDIKINLHLGLEPDQLQAEDQPHRSHRLPQHRHHVSRRFPLRLRWQGRQGNVLTYLRPFG